MRNLSMFILFLIIGKSHAQELQNANWYLGHGVGVHFDTTPPTTSVLPYPLTVTNETYHNTDSHSTVSDANGDLLYFSDGRSVFQLWNGVYEVIADLLPLSTVYWENRLVSIPKPGDPSSYFIISLNNYNSSGSAGGLKYMEMDFSNGLGQIVSQDNYLKDGNNTVIGSGYELTSSGINATVHSDGENYWLIVHVRNQNYSSILSYKVTDTGIADTPSGTAIFPNVGSNELRISSNAQKIAIATSEGVYLGNFNYTDGTIMMNPAPLTSTVNINYSGVEFSPNSDNLYYSTAKLSLLQVIDVHNPSNEITLSKTPFDKIQRAVDGKIYLTNSNLSFSLSVIHDPDNISAPGLSIGTLACNELVESGLPQWVHSNFCTEEEISGIFTNNLGQLEWDDTSYAYTIEVIGDDECNWPEEAPFNSGVPPMYGTVTITDNFIFIETLSYLVDTKEFRWRIKPQCGVWSDWCCYDGNFSLPYPYPFINGTCFHGAQPCNADYNLYVTQAVLFNENVEEQAANMIVATNTINNGAVADYHAANMVVLEPDFHAKSGADFIAHIEECTDVQNRPAGNKQSKKYVEAQNGRPLNREATLKTVSISPNPAMQFTQIVVENSKLRNIIVYSVEGKIMFNKQTEHTNSYQLDTSSLSKGIYFICIETVDGKIHSEKLLKN